jgi:hypothetical protein
MKFTLILLLNFALLLSAFAQEDKTTRDIPKNKNYQTLSELINGQWKLDRIADAEQKKNSGGEEGFDDQQVTNGMQIIEFMDDSRYKLNNSTTAVDSGNYVVNERNKSIVLESDQASNTPAEWNISIKKDEMILVPREAADKRYTYVYSRTKAKAAK